MSVTEDKKVIYGLDANINNNFIHGSCVVCFLSYHKRRY